MSYSEEILSQFDRYTSGSMTTEEQQVFERSLKDNQSLRQSYNEYLHLKQGLAEFAYKQMSEKIDSWESEVATEKSGKVVSLKKWYLVAATISMILVAAISWWKINTPESAENLYASYYEPYPDVLSSRGEGEQLLTEGLFNYESGNYKEAVTFLKNYLTTNEENKEVLFYLGQTYLANNEADNALEIFINLRKQKGFVLQEANQWYLALTYLKLEDKQSAKIILQQIVGNTNHAYRERSKIIIEKIN